ncbi:MAG TPA: CopD family protein [Candidatus Bathyarchaeia archaeon]|nr:CopD family protein [Candidatus Bathyarchaeia archaeon]
MAGFIDVLLRGLALCGQAAAIGGVVFWLVVLRPAARQRPELAPLVQRLLRLIVVGALAVSAGQLLTLGVQQVVLAGDHGWPVRDVLATAYFEASVLRVLACVAIIVGAVSLMRRPDSRGWWAAMAAFTVVLAAGSAAISHAAARIEHGGVLRLFDGLHQYAASVWVGGLMHLCLAAFGKPREPWPSMMLKRFSAMALTGVAVLVVAGFGLTYYYVDGLGAFTGTAYGMMVGTKIAVLGLLMVLGGLNFLVVRRLPDADEVSVLRLRRFVEVELGLGITVLFAAASLTSLPPAVDVVADRATLAEVAHVFAPRLPSFTSSKLEDMPLEDRLAPRTDADRQWSEFNHHVAGAFVLLMGLLAILARTGWAPWARHWPLVFFGLAAFLLVRNDPGSWPLGPMGFWEGMQYSEVVQHRIFVLLVLGFGTFEWMVRTGRIRSARAALVFPILCSVGGALLLTHSHASLNLKAEYLIEVTHAPLGVLAMLVGWGRWLELRLPPGERQLPGRVWSVCLALVGVMLLLYRES